MADEMTDDEFRMALAVQNNELRWQLNQIRSGPNGPARWRRLRLLQVRCRDCGDTVAEVMDTRPWRTLRVRVTVDRQTSEADSAEYAAMAEANETGRLSAGEFGKWMDEWRSRQPVSIRKGDWTFVPLPADGSAACDEDRRIGRWRSSCSCSRTEVMSMRMIYEAIDAGRKTITVSPTPRT